MKIPPKEQTSKIQVGDNVLISPEVTHENEWTVGVVIDVEDNSFVGTVISAKTERGEIFFDKEYLFKPMVNNHVCTQL